ncbi:hypothetical protein NQ314_001237 [Rhamnusium bicolor]|uniref:NTF2 domain-containing protein n=1 Tax=Rhamnusium bicolor TaxID=1586634 RepID=A0AAV8ZVK3_9CUCU|nr:hypothetical protein NQ314_001237 [Rhamnusium bicolor]
MTNFKDEGGILEILSKLEEDDLCALSRTITQGLLKISSKDDAIKGILKYSPDELSILRRKALTREILFSYLDEKNITVKLPTTKNELIDKIIQFWNISRPRLRSQEDSSQTVCNQDGQEVGDRNEAAKEDNNISVLAEQFSKWFYSLMNSEECIGSEHFFPDAKLKLDLYFGNDCHSTVVEDSPEEIVQALLQVKLQHNLFFNPNVSKEGIQGRMDPHGLVIVLACGTLHIQQACAGIFEQVFALARDPFCDNNWKIKNTHLNLRSKNSVVSEPRLCDNELTSNLLTLPSE